MRLAPLLLLAACSSPAPTTTSTHPGDDVVVTIDAAPEPVAVVPPDAAPAGPCFYDTALDRVADGALVLCNGIETGEYDTDYTDCHVVRGDGFTTEAEATPVGPEAYTVYSSSPGHEATSIKASVCPVPGSCVELFPKLTKGQEVDGAAIDASGKRAALAIQGNNDAPDALEVWDVDKAKLIARVEIARPADRVVRTTDAEFLGDVVLLVRYDRDTATSAGTLWKVAGKKLDRIATLTGDVRASAATDPGHAAIVLGDAIAIIEVATGKSLGSAFWIDILDSEHRRYYEGADLDLLIAGTDDAVGVLVMEGDDGIAWAAGVVHPMAGKAERTPIRICPAEGEDEEEPDDAED